MKISKKKAVLLLLFSIFTIGAAGCEKKEAKLGEETAAAESSIPEDGNLKDSSSDMTKEQAAIETSELAETEETDESEGESVNGDTYLLPGSDQEYVTPEDLADMDQERLQLARNEIYARHGRRFQTAEIQEYFDSMPWYEGRIEPEDFQEEMLTPLEQINVSYLKSWEEELDGRAPKDTWFFQIISRLKAAPEYELYPDTMKDCGDYYQVDARIWQVNYVPLKEYESCLLYTSSGRKM